MPCMRMHKELAWVRVRSLFRTRTRPCSCLLRRPPQRLSPLVRPAGACQWHGLPAWQGHRARRPHRHVRAPFSGSGARWGCPAATLWGRASAPKGEQPSSAQPDYADRVKQGPACHFALRLRGCHRFAQVCARPRDQSHSSACSSARIGCAPPLASALGPCTRSRDSLHLSQPTAGSHRVGSAP